MQHDLALQMSPVTATENGQNWHGEFSRGGAGVGGYYLPHPSDAHDQVFDVPEALLALGGRQLVSVTEEGVHIGSDGSAVHAQLHRCGVVGSRLQGWAG